MKSLSRNKQTIFKFIFLLGAIYTPVLFSWLLYPLGIGATLLLTVFSLCLSYVGFQFTKKIVELIFIYLNLLLSFFIAARSATQLYYNNISSDDMTIIVGDIFTIGAISIILFASLILLIIRIIRIKNQNSNE